MKCAAPILLMAIIALASPLSAQNSRDGNAQLSAPDACPSWNKKQPESKAAYFAYLRKSQGRQTNPYRQYSEPAAYHPAGNNAPAHSAAQNNFRTEPRNTATAQVTGSARPAPVKQPEPPQAKETAAAFSSPEDNKPAVLPEEKATPAQKAAEAPSVKAANAAAFLRAEKAATGKKISGLKKNKGTRIKKTKFKKNRATKCPAF